MALEDEITKFIEDELAQDLPHDVAPDDDLIELGVIDSIGLMRILQFVENRKGREIPGRYVTPENFSTVNNICTLVSELGARDEAT